MLIKDSIIEFFKLKMDIDVSSVSISSMELPDSALGMYFHATNSIGIDVNKIHQLYKGVADIFIDTTVVHELVHLCQFQYNKSLILPLNSLFSGSLVNNRYVHLPAYQQPIEIDALMMECYYLYCAEEYNSNGVVVYAEHVLKNVKEEDIVQYAERLNNKEFSSLIISSIKNNKNKKGC